MSENYEKRDLPEDFSVDEEAGEIIYFTDENGKEATEPFSLGNALGTTKSFFTGEPVNLDTLKDNLALKSFEGSNQSTAEISNSSDGITTSILLPNNTEIKIVPPPYEPEYLQILMNASSVHSSAVMTKVRDSVARSYKIRPALPIRDDTSEKAEDVHGQYITKQEFVDDCIKISKFLSNVHKIHAFEDLCSLVAMDKESIGWGAFEVIRERSGKVARLNHVPATRFRVVEGWNGFVEIVKFNKDSLGQDVPVYKYYQNFGDKIQVSDTFDGEVVGRRPYNPEDDGELEIGERNIDWNFVSFKDGKSPATFETSANEILYLPNVHNSTIYYGQADVVPAIGAILANVYIRDHLINFFEHNCVPRYAVIIKGAKIDKKFKEYIQNYFKTSVKGSTHQTMVLALAGMGQKNIEIKFEKIDADRKEADFLETRKDNDQIIMTAEGVSAALLAINDSASLGSGKGLSQAELYKDRIVIPLQLFWARKLNKLFRLGLGCKNAVIEFDPLDTRDALTTAQVLNLMLVLGVLTVNEARGKLGMEAIPGGDCAVIRISPSAAMKVSDLPLLEIEMMDKLSSPSLDESGNVTDITLGERQEGMINNDTTME